MKLIQFFILLFFLKGWLQAQVVIVAPQNGDRICVGTSFVNLDTLRITESRRMDISIGSNRRLVLLAPTGFEFNTGASATVRFSGTDLTSIGFTLERDSLVIFLNVADTQSIDGFFVAGWQVRSTSAGSGSLSLGRGTTALINGISSTTNFGNLNGEAPPSTPSITNTKFAFCSYEPRRLTASARSNPNEQYLWYRNDTLLVGQNDSVLNFTLTGRYRVALRNTVTGCLSQLSPQVTVTFLPEVRAFAGSDKTTCVGRGVTIGSDTATASGGNGFYSIFWTPATGLNNTKSSNPIASPSQTTEYEVTVTDGNGCFAKDKVLVSVRDTAKIDFEPLSRTVFGLSSPPYDLESNLLASVSPSSGTYFYLGNGVAQNPNESKRFFFYPAIAGVGRHRIGYFHTLPNGCVSRKDTIFEVMDGLVLGLDSVYCSNASEVELTVNTSKLGLFAFERIALFRNGIYYSDTSYLKAKVGFSNRFIFDPSVFFNLVGNGAFSVSVFAKRANNSVFSFNDEAASSRLKASHTRPEITLKEIYCQNSASEQVSFKLSAFTLNSVAGIGVIKVADQYRFIPNLVTFSGSDTTRNLTLTVDYSFDGCDFQGDYTITVNRTPQQLNINSFTYCLGDTVKPLSADSLVNGGQVFWYNAQNDALLYVGKSFDPNESIVNPTRSGAYSFYAIQSSSQGCLSTKRDFDITINDTAVISINGRVNFETCESDNLLFFNLENSDTTGTIEYFVNDVEVLNLQNITSKQLGAGFHKISAINTSVKGCKSYTEIKGRVFPAPKARFKNLPVEICQNTPRFEIEIESDLAIFSKFISSTNSSTVVFFDALTNKYYLDALDTGLHILEGSVFSGPSDGFCESIFYDTIYVRPAPTVSLLGSNLFCANDSSVVVEWTPKPSEGLGGTVSFQVAGFTDLGGGKVLINPSALYEAMNNGDNLPKTANLLYTFTDSAGCSNISATGITILPSPTPTISIAGNKRSFCFLDDSVLILGNANLGGTGFFRGRGLTSFGSNNVYFSPSLASLESGVNFESSDSSLHRIVYIFESAQGGCVDSAEVWLRVRPMPKAEFSVRSTSFCIDESPASLTADFPKSVPSSVSFSGRGVITYNDGRTFFFPNIAAQSVADTITETSPQTPTFHDIVAEFTSLSGKCVDRITKTFTVNPLPLPQILGLKDEYCIDQKADTISGLPEESVGTKGRFTGGNVVNLSGGRAIFRPSVAGVGLHNITYTYENQNGCINKKTQTIRVIDRPELAVSVPQTVFCFDDDSVELLGSSSQPAGTVEGIFIGRGIYNHAPNKAYFYPKRAALQAGLDSGSSASSFHKIEYQFTNSLNCTYKQEVNLVVHPVPKADFAIDSKDLTDTIEFCINETEKRLIPINSKGLVLSSIEFEGAGVSRNVLGEYFFQPRTAALAAGSLNDSLPQSPTFHLIAVKFTASNGGCTDSEIRVMKVNPLPRVSVYGFEPEYCLSELPDTLFGNGNGTFSSTTASLINVGEGKALFSPSASGTGSHTIKYSLTNEQACTSERSFSVLVNALPQVSFSGFNTSRAYCYFADSVLLTGVPTSDRGKFLGNGVKDNRNGTAWFNPSKAAQSIGRGPTDPSSFHRIVWAYTDAKGCIDSAVQTIRVDSLPEMGLSLSNGEPIASSYCYSQPQLTLKGTPIPISGGSGVFAGRGITDNRDGTATFSPRSAQLVLGRGEQDPEATHTITYTYTNASGCTNTISTEVAVRPLPTMSFVAPKNQYCNDDRPDTILSLPSGSTGRYFIASATPNAQLLAPTRANGLLDLGNGKAVFFPLEAASRAGSTRPFDPPTNHSIVYRFTNSSGCDSTISRIITVLPTPQPDIISQKRDYCIDDPIDTLFGRPAVVAGVTSGSFFGSGVVDLGNGKALFNPRNALPNSNVIFNFTNSDGCSNSVSINLNVFALPVAYFTAPTSLPIPAGEVWPDSVCFNTAPFRIITDSTSPLRSFNYSLQTQNQDGTFRSGQGLSSDGFFLANLAGAGVHKITLNYIHQNGCDSTFSRLIRVSPDPKPDFEVIRQCESDSVLFLDLSTVPLPGIIKERRWDFGYSFNGENARTTFLGKKDTVAHFFLREAGEYNVTLTIETTDGCINSVQKRIKVGATPTVSFEFANQCEGNQTVFNSISKVDFSNIVSYLWDFEGNGLTEAGEQTAHVFSRPGRFDVKHSVVSTEGCRSDTTIEVIIYPVVNRFPYSENFENGNAGWNQYGYRNTWQVGKPTGRMISSASKGDNAWVTNLAGSADSLERSFVESPCFDLSALRRPMISLDIFSQNSLQSDGAALQYSTDNGKTWKLLGIDTDLFGWYDRAATPLTASPGGSLFGWSGSYLNWKTARNYLDFLKNQSSLRFRVAFASTSPTRTEGFAFDNIYIGERKATVLIEQFRNLNDILFDERLAASTYDLLDQYHNTKDSVIDAVAITYHIETPNLRGDSLYNQNKQDPGARSFFYGVQQAGRNLVDGDILTPRSDNGTLAWNAKLIERNALKDIDFDLKISYISDPEGKLKARVYLTSNKEMDFEDEVTLYFVAVERFISTRYEGRSVNLEWTLRKMLPNAGGTVFRRKWKFGETDSVDFSWQPVNVLNSDTLGAVVFVQNTNSQSSEYRKVYQTVYKEPKLPLRVVSGFDAAELGELMLYPNPASTLAYVMFSGKALNPYTWKLFNMQGQKASTGTLDRGSNGFIVDLRSLSKGVYLLEIKGLTLKLMVE